MAQSQPYAPCGILSILYVVHGGSSFEQGTEPQSVPVDLADAQRGSLHHQCECNARFKVSYRDVNNSSIFD